MCTPPPERLTPVLSSGSCRAPVVRLCILLVGGAEATFSVIQQTMDFTQPRPYSFFLCCRCRRRVPGGVHGRSAGCTVRSGSSMILGAVLHSLDLCHRHSLGDSLVFFIRTTCLVVLPLTRPIFIIGLVTAGGPLTPARAAVLRVLLSGWCPTPVIPGGRLAILSRVARHVRIRSGSV